MNFKEFISVPSSISTKEEPWRADKDEIIDHWTSLPPNMPVGQPRTIPSKYRGSTLRFDGIRIAGSANFINAAMSRLKDLLTFEGEQTRLQTIYKQQVDKKTGYPVPQSFVFYVQVKDQSPKETKTKPPKVPKPV